MVETAVVKNDKRNTDDIRFESRGALEKILVSQNEFHWSQV